MKDKTLDEVGKILDEVGTTFCDLAERADGGSLLFFPSKEMMRTYLKSWQSNTTLW